MKIFCTAATALLLVACAEQPPVRSPLTLNSSMPRSQGLQSYAVVHYSLRNDIQIEQKSISGSSEITFRATRAMTTLELDFDGLFNIDRVSDEAGPLAYTRDEAKLYVQLRGEVAAGDTHSVLVAYHGKPHEAVRPPWSGGFQWSETPSGKPWVATAIQGEGCDLWWPCMDHPLGEPEGMDLYFTVDAGLTAVSNGVLVGVETREDGRQTFHWRTSVATNTYGVALNVAPYTLLETTYSSSNGTQIPVKFWAIEDHAIQARQLLELEFAPTIEFFERRLGPYPWGQEKLGVAETPHLGMEHQTVNAYGNEFRRGEYGFDWLFHHELAHEWFGNVMTHATVSDMWLHEGAGAYMQPVYAQEVIGDAAFHASMYSSYLKIRACNAIAPRQEFSADELYFDDPEGQGPAGDIYAKGAWLLHSLRYLIGDDAFWRSIRILIYDTPDPASLPAPIPARLRSTDDFMRIAGNVAGTDLSWFFEVYARRGPLPELSITDTDTGVLLEWGNVDGLSFPMPIPVRVAGQLQRVEFMHNQASLPGAKSRDLLVDPYMQVLRKLSIVPTCEQRRAEESAAAAAED
ncbi:MAG: M1 family metallopeptidase [Gammaproteobacteria bacterium]|nr:M1 family metallopeptidase [Gammaproteobacteria bacterium]MDH5303042.1 M1 family metallopeptidase [Gammaproteobacteria bacterium]MDH5321204.1 M1 family metallopeptidase [Gammaproteobacteria bacterium]